MMWKAGSVQTAKDVTFNASCLKVHLLGLCPLCLLPGPLLTQLFEIGSHCVAYTGLELAVLLPQSFLFCNHRCVPHSLLPE